MQNKMYFYFILTIRGILYGSISIRNWNDFKMISKTIVNGKWPTWKWYLDRWVQYLIMFLLLGLNYAILNLLTLTGSLNESLHFLQEWKGKQYETIPNLIKISYINLNCLIFATLSLKSVNYHENRP